MEVSPSVPIATSQVLNSYMWLVATILDSGDIEMTVMAEDWIALVLTAH